MIAELGQYALVLALGLGLVQSVAPIIGARTYDSGLMRLGTSTALMQFGFVAISFTALAICYVTSDFSVATVYENSHSLMPLVYKITSVWGNHEGSMLLWVPDSLFVRRAGRLLRQQSPDDIESTGPCGPIMDRLCLLFIYSANFQPLLAAPAGTL